MGLWFGVVKPTSREESIVWCAISELYSYVVEVQFRGLHRGLIQTRSCLEFACFVRGVSIFGIKLNIVLGIEQHRWHYLPYLPDTRDVFRVLNPFLKDCYSQTSFGKTEACEVFVYEW